MEQTLKNKFVNLLIGDIIAGKYAPGTALPSERELSEKLGVSRSVVRSGLAELSALRLIETMDRKGSIVQDVQLNASLPVLNAILSSQGQLYPQLMTGFPGSAAAYRNGNGAACCASPQRRGSLSALWAHPAGAGAAGGERGGAGAAELSISLPHRPRERQPHLSHIPLLHAPHV